MSKIFYLCLDDFLEVIRDFPDDKEVYLNLRDQVQLNKSLSLINICCSSCLSSNHSVYDCPYFFYDKNKKKIFENIQLRDKSFKVNFERNN